MGKKKKIIGARIRVGVGDKGLFEDDEDVEVQGKDIKLIVSPEEARGREIIGMEVQVKVGSFKPFEHVLREIKKRENLDEDTKEQLKAKVKELEKELTKKSIDTGKINGLETWFKNNAPWLIQTISQIISSILH